jgi:hypothetical protein
MVLVSYETLMVEVGSEIGITIVTPGYIESEFVTNVRKCLLQNNYSFIDWK